LWSEGLPYGAIDLLANESEYFGDTEVWSDGLRISNARHLAARIQVLRKTLDRGIPKALGWDHAGSSTSMPAYPSTSPGNRDRIRLVGYEISRLGDENIFWEVQVGVKLGFAEGNKYWPFGSLAVNNA